MVWFKRFNAAALVCACAVSALSAAQAQTYPSKPVRLTVGFAPGGAADIAGRLMAQSLTQALGGNFVVENKPGAGGLMALDMVARSLPDGYSIAVGTPGPLTISPEWYKEELAFDPEEKLDPVVKFASTPGLILVRNDLKADSIGALIELSKKAQPLMMASAGAGSVMHLTGEYFQEQNNINWVHVPYKGSNPALIDLIAGRVDVMVDLEPAALPHIISGRIKALAITAPERSKQLPDVPTMDELGYRGYHLGSWWSLSVPKGTPAGVIEKLNAAINDALKKPEVIKQLASLGAVPAGGSPEDLGQQIREDSERWRRIIQSAKR